MTEGTTFYAIWVDRQPVEGVQAFFFIHLDGTIPVEPNQYTTAGYIGNCGTAYNNGWVGRVNKPLNVVNNVPEVEANVLEEPDEEFLYDQLTALEGNTYFPEADLEKLRALSPLDYGTRWWIDWYACKLSCGSDNVPYSGHYHVDGRLRFSTDLQLTYHANGGVNPPPASRHEQYEQVTPDWSVRPERQNFTFLGWDTSPDAKIPTYPVPGTTYPSGPNESQIWMDTDKILYAVWKPNATTIPMSDKFKGIKYEQTNNGPETAPAAGHRYQFTIRAITLPEGSAPYETQTATSQADGSFSFPQIQVTVPGLYVFEVREVIGDLPVQYDASVYRLTVNIVESDYGLGIAGYSFTRNNRIVTVDGNNLDNMVFEFVNRTGIRDVTATKVWDDGENQDGLRPASVDVHIYRRGDGIWSDSATLTAANNWSWTWEGLEIMNSGSGEIYEYYIVEDAVPQYTATYSGDMNAGLVVTNRYVPRTADFPVEKLWQDDDDAAGIRPETLTYILTGSTPDGTVVSTTVSDPVTDPWRYTFEDMPLYNSGQHLLYTLSEVAIPGYDTTIATIGSSDGGQDYRVTNTLAVTHVTVTKQISGNVANDTEVFPFTAWVYDANGLLLTDIEAGEGYTVGADGAIRFTLGHEGSVELRMLPLGGTIVLTEESGTYTATYAPEGTQTSSGMRYDLTQGLAITVTNTRDATVDTGVTLDTVPYLLLLGLALMHLAGLVIKRRVA